MTFSTEKYSATFFPPSLSCCSCWHHCLPTENTTLYVHWCFLFTARVENPFLYSVFDKHHLDIGTSCSKQTQCYCKHSTHFFSHSAPSPQWRHMNSYQWRWWNRGEAPGTNIDAVSSKELWWIDFVWCAQIFVTFSSQFVDLTLQNNLSQNEPAKPQHDAAADLLLLHLSNDNLTIALSLHLFSANFGCSSPLYPHFYPLINTSSCPLSCLQLYVSFLLYTHA